MELTERCRRVRLLLMDVDGVLTDGGIAYGPAGEIKTFHVRDGLAVKLWQKAGRRAGILSGRTSEIVTRRAAELKIETVIQGADDKRPAFDALLRELGLDEAEVCYIGDDLPDVPLIRRAGMGVAVADACEEARQAARFVTGLGGGRGAVREVVRMLLEAQGLWQEMAAAFT